LRILPSSQVRGIAKKEGRRERERERERTSVNLCMREEMRIKRGS
jgi:hypothetical protein